MDDSGRAWLRSDWVPALEESLALADPRAFMRWMDLRVRPIIGYAMVVCATGSLTPGELSADRVLVRGVPQRLLDSLRDSSGVIVLPRGRLRAPGSLRTVDAIGALTGLAPIAALEAGEAGARRAAFFLFARLDEVLDERQRYLAELLAPHMGAALTRSLADEPTLRAQPRTQATLSRRELELLHWLVAGRTTADIARSTFRSTHTVSNQVRAIMRKLSANNRTEAIAVALGLGLVAPIERQSHTRVMAAQTRVPYRVSRRRRRAATEVFRCDT